MQAKGVTDREEQEAVATGRAGQYRRFGFTAMALSLVPVRQNPKFFAGCIRVMHRYWTALTLWQLELRLSPRQEPDTSACILQVASWALSMLSTCRLPKLDI